MRGSRSCRHVTGLAMTVLGEALHRSLAVAGCRRRWAASRARTAGSVTPVSSIRRYRSGSGRGLEADDHLELVVLAVEPYAAPTRTSACSGVYALADPPVQLCRAPEGGPASRRRRIGTGSGRAGRSARVEVEVLAVVLDEAAGPQLAEDVDHLVRRAAPRRRSPVRSARTPRASSPSDPERHPAPGEHRRGADTAFATVNTSRAGAMKMFVVKWMRS